MKFEEDNVIHGKKTSIDVVRSFATKLNGELLSTEYKDMLSKLDWKCQLGHVFSTTFNHVKNRKQWCPVCGKAKAIKNLKENGMSLEARKKISAGHLKRLNKNNCFTGKKQREIAARLREHVTGILRNSKRHKKILEYLGCSLEEFKQHLESKFYDRST